MVSPLTRRAVAMALLAMLLPLAAAQEPVPEEPPEQIECTAPLETCLPDLIPTNPTARNVDERFATHLCTDFLNVGKGPTATPFRVRIDVDRIPYGERHFTNIYQRGEGEPNICWEAQLYAGDHLLTVAIDSEGEAPESNENNNVRTIAFVIRATPRVDLKLTSFVVTPNAGNARENQLFIANITNVGREISNLTTISFSDDTGLLVNYTLGPLRAGQSTRIAHPTSPAARPWGTFIARAVIDPDNVNAEIDELNNELATEYTILEHPAPDVTITDIELSGSFTEFRGVLANVTVTNLGDQIARQPRIWAMNETNGTVMEAFAPVLIEPNASSTIQMRLVLRAGERSIRFVVDPLKAIAERDEANNERTVALTITPPAADVKQPNLVLERLAVIRSDPRPGDPVSIGALVRNVGTNSSNATIVNFTIDGEHIGSAPVPALKVNASHYASVPWVSPQAGLFRVDVLADGGRRVQELDEEDNGLAMQFLVAFGEPEEEDNATEEPPVVPPTPPTAPTTPTTPTTPTPTPQLPADIAGRVAFSDLTIETRAVPGGLKGIVTASLRNPTIDPIGLLEVTFKADDEVLKRVLVPGIRGAASTAATSGEIDIPAGEHVITAEVRAVGSTETPLVRSETYSAEAGEKSGIPAPGVLGLLGALGLAIVLRRRR